MMRRGLTLIETVVSVVVVSMLFGAAMNVVGSVTATRSLETNRRIAEKLAEDMLAEVLSHTYLDPSGVDGDGPAPGEVSTTHRLWFNDVDDFHGWKASPPIERDGTKITWAKGFTREVQVYKYSNTSGVDLYRVAGQFKLVIVTVFQGNRELAQVLAVRGPDWDFRDFLGVTYKSSGDDD